MTVTDEAGKQRRLRHDGLGRVIQADEGPSFGWTTAYTYDALDNLKQVNQSTQAPRTFVYDSLKRLLRATNPENATTSYAYDLNGNLASRSDARGAISCFGTLNGTTCDSSTGYDTLDRPIKTTYTGTTPAVTHCYDGGFYAAGACGAPAIDQRLRKSGAGSSVSSTEYVYDLAGRAAASTQRMGVDSYAFTYNYYNDDSLASIGYPSGREVTSCYDNLGRTIWVSAARPASECVAGNGAGSAPYASNMTYAPIGGLLTRQLGSNGVTETSAYNNRRQMASKSVTLAGTSLLALGLFYCPAQATGCASNNGNLLSQSISHAAVGGEAAFNQTQLYTTYDEANRIRSFSEGGGVSRGYNYDVYGNRWVESNAGLTLSSLTPNGPAWFSAGNNRMTGVGYDLAGNQTQLNPFALAYDADGRVSSAVSTSNGSASYEYDAEGRRVRKAFCSGGGACTATTANAQVTRYVYDAFGQLLAEYGALTGDLGTSYLSTDHLGSTRLVTNDQGAVAARYDYLPFGEPIPAGINGRSAKYSTGAFPGTSDGRSVKFTGKERDAETGLDYFEARYLSSAQGRFTSTDPVIMGPHKASNPQNWNLYAYARNNPLRFTDPTGEIIVEDIADEYKKRYEKWKKELLSTKTGRALWDKYQNDQNFTLTLKFGPNAGGQQGAETTGYHWSNGKLDAATVLLGSKMDSGYPSGDNYPVTSSLRPGGSQSDLSGQTVAATKLAHEFGHVEATAGTNANLYGLQNMLIGVWNSVFFKTGQTNQPDIERLMGGTPVQVNMMREHAAERQGAIPFLRDRFPGKPGENMPKRIQQAIQNFEKGK